MKRGFRSAAGAAAVHARYRALLQGWPAPSQQLTVPTRAGDTFVMSCGPDGAPPVLALHGSASASFVWMGDAASWMKHLRVHAVDIVGEPGLSAPAMLPLAGGGHAAWIDDVFAALKLDRAALVGMSLGGWLALDYATRRPDRVSAVAAIAPGGVGRQHGILWLLPLLLLGSWGRRKILDRIAGPGGLRDGAITPDVLALIDEIHAQFRPRTEPVPVLSDDALARLTMPVMAVLGAHDVLIDSADSRRRLEATVAHAQIRWREDQGHIVQGYRDDVLGFLVQR